jgi:hypothetical protein
LDEQFGSHRKQDYGFAGACGMRLRRRIIGPVGRDYEPIGSGLGAFGSRMTACGGVELQDQKSKKGRRGFFCQGEKSPKKEKFFASFLPTDLLAGFARSNPAAGFSGQAGE